MLSRRLKVVGVLVLLGSIDVVFAQVTPSWVVSHYDETMGILRAMFGSVNNLLGGQDGLTALQFKIFNIAVMVFASVFISVTITHGVVSSASQGVLMGKKQGQSAYFTLFRSSFGVVAVFPQYNGYSLIQVLVMTIVLKSMSLAGDLSNLIIEHVMRDSPVEIFRQAQGVGARSDAKKNSLLKNESVRDFYNAIYGMSVKSVEYNRAQPEFSKKDFAQSLYDIKYKNGQYTIKFDGVEGEIQLNNLGGNSAVLNERLEQLITPVVSRVFQCLPQGEPEDARARDCRREEIRGSCGFSRSELAQDIVTRINQEHDLFAQLFVLPLISAPDPGTQNVRGFLSNWIMFPFLYQAALDVGASGIKDATLETLMQRAFPQAPDGQVSSPLEKPEPKYTSLGGRYPVIQEINFSGELLESPSRILSSVIPEDRKPETFTDYEQKHAQTVIRGHLYHISQAVHTDPNSASITTTLDSKSDQSEINAFFEDSSGKNLETLWNKFNPRGDYKNRFFSSMSAESIAMREPVDAFLRSTGQAFTETFIKMGDGDPKVVATPVTALSELAVNVSKDTVLFMLTLMRNVAAEQILNAWHTFWEFFITKIGTSGLAAGTEMLQEYANDGTACLTLNVIFGPGSSPRRPACNPMFFTLAPFPIFNPGWGIEFGVNIAMQIITTTANVTARVADDLLTSYFTYTYMLKSQFKYVYYTYILIAATPIMIISNLLALWIPMLPPLVYFIAVVGWLFAVIEAMIASPLIVLGMTFPQGHDFLGSSQQALILLLSVFVRAPLIVIGFFMSMLILYTSMVIVGYAVVPIVLNLFDQTTITLGDAFMMYAFMLIMFYVTGSLLSQTLGLTYKLPNTIVAWIGGQNTEGTESAAVGQLQSVVSQQQPFTSIQEAGLSNRNSIASQAGSGGNAGSKFV